jgi:heme/copper-type cytochrome/quinol oxidase subunit 3
MEQEEQHSAHGQFESNALGVDNRKLGVWVFLASEAVFFGGLITTFAVETARNNRGPYPREVLSLPLVSINTFVLISSSLAMVTALSNVQENKIRRAISWLVVTAVLGLAFLGGQAYEFIHLFENGLSLDQNLFGASFFTLTTTHGLHVLSGIIWIILVIFQLLRFRGDSSQAAMKVELTGLYWHFVDLIWIIIFTVVYLLHT